MIIKYEFADGTISEVEVDDEYGKLHQQMERDFENDERQYRYWVKQSLDNCNYEGDWFQDPSPTPLEKRIQEEEELERINEQKDYEEKYKRFLNSLTNTQKRRLELREKGMSFREIAAIEKVHHKTIEESFEQVKKKFLLFFKK